MRPFSLAYSAQVFASEFPQSTELFGALKVSPALMSSPVLAALGEDQLELRVYNRLPARGA